MDTAESEATDERLPASTFERGVNFTSSFHGDRYYSEDIYKLTDHVKVSFCAHDIWLKNRVYISCLIILFIKAIILKRQINRNPNVNIIVLNT